MRLKDRVAIITGASSGIGRATADLFAREGAKVLIADVDNDGGRTTVDNILHNNGIGHFVCADISKETDAKRISDEAVRMFGQINILVNNAATFVLKGFNATIEDWQRSLAINVMGTFLSTKYAAECMKRVGGGAIVNLSSISAFVAQPDFFVYSATKAAILQMTRNMAMDLAPYGIRVNCVCPGAILTAASHRYLKEVGITLAQFESGVADNTFLKRVGDPREVANAVLFLSSDEASYITGTSLTVDGGYTAH